MGKTKRLNENEDTNKKHQTGGESNLSCYLFLYLYFKNCVKVGRWEREESRWLLSQSDHMFGWRSVFRWKDSECVHMLHLKSHAPLTSKVMRLGQGRVSQTSLEALHPLGVFVVHVNMFTVAGHSPLINIELFFLLYLLKSFNSSKHVLLLYFNFCFSC